MDVFTTFAFKMNYMLEFTAYMLSTQFTTIIFVLALCFYTQRNAQHVAMLNVEFIFNLICVRKELKMASPVGFEPTTSGLEVRRAIHCATGT